MSSPEPADEHITLALTEDDELARVVECKASVSADAVPTPSVECIAPTVSTPLPQCLTSLQRRWIHSFMMTLTSPAVMALLIECAGGL